MIPFNKPPITGNEERYISEALRLPKISGDGFFSEKCHTWFEENIGCKKALLTPSCTHALEIAAILLDIKPGDEVIMPSYTFVSTANAFVLRGATIVFVDVRPDTMNMNESRIEEAITSQTKAIVPVHYAGVGCDMDVIMNLADKYDLFVVEDAAQGMMSTYKGRKLGSIGHLAAYSFHETKNYTSGGEGGLLLINDQRFMERSEIIREKGTNRSQFFRGDVDKYTWVDIGSSYLPCEIQAAFLWGQLESVDNILQSRLKTWDTYANELHILNETHGISFPSIPDECAHNGHMFYMKLQDQNMRDDFISFMRQGDIHPVFHYIPLHSSPAGVKYGRLSGEDRYTSRESERLVRLPLWYNMPADVIEQILNRIFQFFEVPEFK